MATLSKHGAELLRLEYFTASVSYREDGNILRNTGNGWKLYRKVNPGVNPVENANAARIRWQERNEKYPTLAIFRKILSKYGPHARNLIYTTLQLMPTDPDGVWSNCDDYGYRVDLSDLVELSRLFEPAMAELKAWELEKKS
jgi:hypothetical protein